MKSLIYFFISIFVVITLTSAIQKTTISNKTLTLQPTQENVDLPLLRKSADIISSRLRLYGLSSFEVKVLPDRGQIKIELADNTYISEIEGFVASKGELAFYETYTQSEIKDMLKSDNPLFKLLNHNKEAKPSDPRIGCSVTDNRTEAEKYIRAANTLKNCKLVWGKESKKSGFCLFALKTNDNGDAFLMKSDVDSVKIAITPGSNEPKIQIRLKPAASKVFEDATRKDLYKSIAIVIDDKVYSWPVVQNVIEGGAIEVTGDFSEQEVKYLPAVFNTAQLPVTFKILK
jgi:SecD/SecF fusion protein